MANEIKHYSPGTIASPIAPVAGTYTLTFGGATTAAIEWDDDETAVQTALEALASIGSGNVQVTSDFNNGFYVEFIGDLADFNLGPLTANSSLKQSAATVTVTETQAGEAGVSTQIFDCSLDDAPTEGKFILSESTNGDTAAIDYNASAAAVESAIDAVVGYSVSGSTGGPWTCESDAQEAYSWSGAEDPSGPLRKALGIEVVTDQEGDNDWEGSGGVAFGVSGLAGTGTISSTGSGAIELPVSGLTGVGNHPYSGGGSVEIGVSALAGAGDVPYVGSGTVEFVVSALAANGLIDSTGTADLALPVSGLAASGNLTVLGSVEVRMGFALAGDVELADTRLGFKHYRAYSNLQRVLQL